jgi:hypothetical protein
LTLLQDSGYAHCIDGQADAANRRITDALGTADAKPGPGDEGDDDSARALLASMGPVTGIIPT